MGINARVRDFLTCVGGLAASAYVTGLSQLLSRIETGHNGSDPSLSQLYDVAYNAIMFTILRSATFDRWLSRLRDRQAVNRIVARLLAAEDGHLGDVRPVGSGVSEMRIQYGPGYRVYFITPGAELIILLCGGNKDSQRRDIERAKRMATEWRD